MQLQSIAARLSEPALSTVTPPAIRLTPSTCGTNLAADSSRTLTTRALTTARLCLPTHTPVTADATDSATQTNAPAGTEPASDVGTGAENLTNAINALNQQRTVVENALKKQKEAEDHAHAWHDKATLGEPDNIFDDAYGEALAEHNAAIGDTNRELDKLNDLAVQFNQALQEFLSTIAQTANSAR